MYIPGMKVLADSSTYNKEIHVYKGFMLIEDPRDEVKPISLKYEPKTMDSIMSTQDDKAVYFKANSPQARKPSGIKNLPKNPKRFTAKGLVRCGKKGK